MRLSVKKGAFFLFLIFIILGVLTLPHYGINWDTINHLPRGQAYLHFFLTGKKDFRDLPAFKPYWQNPENLLIDADIPKEKAHLRSFYESDATTFNWFLEHDGKGHPPLSDILSSVFNQILFKQLGLINDIDSYRVYGIFLAAILVGLIYWWGAKAYGKFAGFLAAIALSTYPLFWSEAHFNSEKDIPETVFWVLTIFSVWKGLVNQSSKWILLSGLFFGLALGTKFNILFASFVLTAWIAIFFGVNFFKNSIQGLKSYRKVFLASLFAPLIGIFIFFISWPYLWSDPLGNAANVVGFYKELGITKSQDPNFLGPMGTNSYPLQWIIYTAPPVTLTFAALGIAVAAKRLRKEKDKISVLFLLMLFVPIIRVSLPGTTIYGGVRQIMEYIPALAILAGLGGLAVRNALLVLTLKMNFPKIIINILIILTFLPITIKLIKIHPNENVYFNQLIGGLSGAKQRNFPSWGHTFGAAYRQGFAWINKNAPKDSKVVFVYELLPNFPKIFVRGDIDLHNSHRSGYLMLGEYAITLVYQGTENRSYYDMYLNNFLNPVYQVAVDDVAILKVWKNDISHLKVKLQEEHELRADVKKSKSGLRFILPEQRKLSRLEIKFNEQNCQGLNSGYVQISEDGEKWNRLPGILPKSWRIAKLGEQPQNSSFIEPFIGQKAKFVELVLAPEDTCLNNIETFKLFYYL